MAMVKQTCKIKWITVLTFHFILGFLVVPEYFHSAKAQSININSTSKSSNDTVHGINLQRTRVYDSKGVDMPKSLRWQTNKLFVLKESIHFSSQMGTISYYGWLLTSYGISQPILIDGTIYFTSSVGNGYLYSLAADTGKEKKTLKIKDVALSPPAIAGDIIFLGGSDGSLRAVNRNTGETKWHIEKKGYSFNVAELMVADNILYFGGAQFTINASERPEGTVHALDLGKGEQKWMFKIKGIPTSAAISGDTILFGDMDRQLFALDRHSGQEKWRFKAGANVKSPAIMDESVYFIDENGNSYCVSFKDGQLKWKATKVKAFGAPALSNGLALFTGRDNSVYAVDAETGNDKWVFKISEICSIPVIANAVVYFACSDKTIYAVDVHTGQEKWRYKNKNSILTAPLIGDGVMYFLDNNGYMYAIH